jgi:hypothetical protein
VVKHIKNIKSVQLPKNLYNLAKSYFSERTATMNTNTIQIERDVSKGCCKNAAADLAFGIFNSTHCSILILENEPRQ